MITVLIGARGTGKSSLLERMQEYLGEQTKFFDLDLEIEKFQQQSVSEIFSQLGEGHFRHLEKTTFEHLLTQHDNRRSVFIAVGGGFDLQSIPDHVRVLWLQRRSDQWGRIFLDRPALNPELGPLEEFQSRQAMRVPKYREAAWEEYLIPEGLDSSNNIEKQILFGPLVNVKGCLTLLPQNFASERRWSYFIKKRLMWGVKYFEIRDDLLSEDQIALALRDIPKDQILWSRRTHQISVLFSPSQAGLIDWDRELLKDADLNSSSMVSVHSFRDGETLEMIFDEFSRLSSSGCQFKLAVEIKCFSDLEKGHNWQKENPEKRSFLPRSANGDWRWYRLWQGASQKINFWREGEGSAADQPSLFEWLSRLDKKKDSFAALLGDPVEHSFTPIVQGAFFEKNQQSVFAIRIPEDEWSGASCILKNWGLLAAAVTSPLKRKAFDECKNVSPRAQKLGAVNTLYFRESQGWQGENTDFEGLTALAAEAQKLCPVEDETEIAVWGGGGTLTLMQTQWPRAHYFSIQTGEVREGIVNSQWNPRWLVWAAGLWAQKGTKAPPSSWNPELILDLNYRMDSGGLYYAKKIGAKYISGEVMFRAQALGQQKFWTVMQEL